MRETLNATGRSIYRDLRLIPPLRLGVSFIATSFLSTVALTVSSPVIFYSLIAGIAGLNAHLLLKSFREEKTALLVQPPLSYIKLEGSSRDRRTVVQTQALLNAWLQIGKKNIKQKIAPHIKDAEEAASRLRAAAVIKGIHQHALEIPLFSESFGPREGLVTTLKTKDAFLSAAAQRAQEERTYDPTSTPLLSKLKKQKLY